MMVSSSKLLSCSRTDRCQSVWFGASHIGGASEHVSIRYMITFITRSWPHRNLVSSAKLFIGSSDVPFDMELHVYYYYYFLTTLYHYCGIRVISTYRWRYWAHIFHISHISQDSDHLERWNLRKSCCIGQVLTDHGPLNLEIRHTKHGVFSKVVQGRSTTYNLMGRVIRNSIWRWRYRQTC